VRELVGGQPALPRDELIQVDDRCPPHLGLAQVPPGRVRLSRRLHLRGRQPGIQRPERRPVRMHDTKDVISDAAWPDPRAGVWAR
jgi:hypothetical protein